MKCGFSDGGLNVQLYIGLASCVRNLGQFLGISPHPRLFLE